MIDNTQTLPIDRTTAAKASSAHARINVAINLDNWRHLPTEVSDSLLWFHQHALDEHLGWEAVSDALGYDDAKIGYKLIFGALTGVLDQYDDIVGRIESYRKLIQDRSGIIRTEFAENPIAKLIWAGLDYAVANQSITLIEGDSGHGKSLCTEIWSKMDRNNHGKNVRVEANAIGGTRVFLGEICKATGNNKNASIGQMRDAIFRAFNSNRMLIIDEATRLLPTDRRSTPEKVEFLRELHDRCGSPLALIATVRLQQDLMKSSYIFEQTLGRIGMPIRLPHELKEEHFRPIVVQYFPKPGRKLLEACEQIANNRLPRQQGRLRLLSQILRLSSRIASKRAGKTGRVRLTEDDFFRAMNIRDEMMGGRFA